MYRISLFFLTLLLLILCTASTCSRGTDAPPQESRDSSNQPPIKHPEEQRPGPNPTSLDEVLSAEDKADLEFIQSEQQQPMSTLENESEWEKSYFALNPRPALKPLYLANLNIWRLTGQKGVGNQFKVHHSVVDLSSSIDQLGSSLHSFYRRLQIGITILPKKLQSLHRCLEGKGRDNPGKCESYAQAYIDKKKEFFNESSVDLNRILTSLRPVS